MNHIKQGKGFGPKIGVVVKSFWIVLPVISKQRQLDGKSLAIDKHAYHLCVGHGVSRHPNDQAIEEQDANSQIK